MAKSVLPKLIIGALAVVGLGVVGALVAKDWSDHKARLEAQSAKLNFTGPPCKQVSKAAFLASPTLFGGRDIAHGKTAEFEGVEYLRESGKVLCNEHIAKNSLTLDTYQVCQFNHPRKLQVTIGTESFYFLTDENPVVVSLPDKKVVCVITSTFAG